MLNSFLRLYEDVIQFQDAPPSRRRDILTGLNDNLTEIFVFALDSIVNRLPNAVCSLFTLLSIQIRIHSSTATHLTSVVSHYVHWEGS